MILGLKKQNQWQNVTRAYGEDKFENTASIKDKDEVKGKHMCGEEILDSDYLIAQIQVWRVWDVAL